MTPVVGAIGRLQQRVELSQALDPRDRDQVPAAEAADFALDSALLVGALQARRAEERVEAEV